MGVQNTAASGPWLPSLPQAGRESSLQQGWQPSAWSLSLPLPEDLPAFAAGVLRECHLHVGGPLTGADPQDLRARKCGGLVWGRGRGFQHSTLSTPSVWGESDSMFPPILWTTCPHSAWSLPLACECEEAPVSLYPWSQHSTSGGMGPMPWSQRDIC